MPDAIDDTWIELGDFVFDAASGTLRNRRADSEVRLPPQPSALLAFLLEKEGAVASREEIRARLWPDVTIDFESSLHHCVRQIRAALGDIAASPRYVETIPRRGYRLVCGIVATPLKGPIALLPSRRRFVAAGLGGIAVIVVGFVAWQFGKAPAATRLRLGILSFAWPSMSAAAVTEASRAGDHVLVELTAALGVRGDVVGPRTTDPLVASGMSLADLADELGLDYLLNVRRSGGDSSDEVLVELIRARDGRHVWVERFSRLDSDVATVISTAVAAELGAAMLPDQ